MLPQNNMRCFRYASVWACLRVLFPSAFMTSSLFHLPFLKYYRILFFFKYFVSTQVFAHKSKINRKTDEWKYIASQHITTLFTFKQTLLMWYEAVIQVDNNGCEFWLYTALQVCVVTGCQVQIHILCTLYLYRVHPQKHTHTHLWINLTSIRISTSSSFCVPLWVFLVNSVWRDKMTRSENHL